MNVYTAEIEIQLSTLLSNVCLPDCLPKRVSTVLNMVTYKKI